MNTISNKNFFTKENYNTKLLETNNFVVVPSLGALVEGWVLIVPKTSHLNLGQLNPSQLDELESVIKETELIISSRFGERVVLFEHGPSVEKSQVGCGVDYAHLHMVPVDFNLIDGLKEYLNTEYQWKQIRATSEVRNFSDASTNYLYLRDQLGRHFITSNNNIPSQLFRKVIAHFLGTPDKFDWKKFPELNKIENTISLLQQSELV